MGGDCLTVQEWLVRFESDPEEACILLLAWGAKAVRSRMGRGRASRSSADDLAQEAAFRIIQEEAKLMRSADPEASGAAYVHGVVAKVALEWHRANSGAGATDPGSLDALGGRDESSPAPGGCFADLDDARMTERQRAAFRLVLSGRRKAEAARDLGIRRQTLDERLVRGGKRALRDDDPKPRDRAWARRLASDSDLYMPPDTRRALHLHAAGSSIREISDALGLSRDAARGRLRRAWKLWGRLSDRER